MGASRFARRQFERHRRLAAVADLSVSLSCAMSTPLSIAQVVDSLRDILASDLSAENVFDMLPLHSMFSNLLLTFSDAVRKSLSEAGAAAID